MTGKRKNIFPRSEYLKSGCAYTTKKNGVCCQIKKRKTGPAGHRAPVAVVLAAVAAYLLCGCAGQAASTEDEIGARLSDIQAAAEQTSQERQETELIDAQTFEDRVANLDREVLPDDAGAAVSFGFSRTAFLNAEDDRGEDTDLIGGSLKEFINEYLTEYFEALQDPFSDIHAVLDGYFLKTNGDDVTMDSLQYVKDTFAAAETIIEYKGVWIPAFPLCRMTWHMSEDSQAADSETINVRTTAFARVIMSSDDIEENEYLMSFDIWIYEMPEGGYRLVTAKMGRLYAYQDPDYFRVYPQTSHVTGYYYLGIPMYELSTIYSREAEVEAETASDDAVSEILGTMNHIQTEPLITDIDYEALKEADPELWADE